MNLLKWNLCTQPHTLQKREAQAFIKIITIENVFFYSVLLAITLMPILNHGCHSSPHADDELCLDVIETENNCPSANRKSPTK